MRRDLYRKRQEILPNWPWPLAFFTKINQYSIKKFQPQNGAFFPCDSHYPEVSGFPEFVLSSSFQRWQYLPTVPGAPLYIFLKQKGDYFVRISHFYKLLHIVALPRLALSSNTLPWNYENYALSLNISRQLRLTNKLPDILRNILPSMWLRISHSFFETLVTGKQAEINMWAFDFYQPPGPTFSILRACIDLPTNEFWRFIEKTD